MLLNKADQALIVDILIAEGKKTNNTFIALEYLKLIKKVKALEVETIKNDLTMDQVFDQMDQLDIQ